VSCTKVRKSLDNTLWMQKEQTFPLRPGDWLLSSGKITEQLQMSKEGNYKAVGAKDV
jgi:hypothetical protein